MGAKYGMKLNKKKCELLHFGTIGPIHFSDGKPLKPVQEAKYLGCMLSSQGDAHTEVRKRTATCMSVLKRLDLFW